MSSLDDPDGADPPTSAEGPELSRRADSLLIETLIYVLIEKGVLTRTDAMSIVQTVAEVMRGMQADGRASAETAADVASLHRLFMSFEALDDRSAAVAEAGNVHRLRPPLHGDRPEFPDEDD